MASKNRIDGDPVRADDVLAAARQGDPAARWEALAACRTYLRLVVGKNRWVKRDGGPDTSDLVQNAILDGWRGFSRFEGRTPGQLRAWLRVMLIHSLIKTRRRPREARTHHRQTPASPLREWQASRLRAKREASSSCFSSTHRTGPK